MADGFQSVLTDGVLTLTFDRPEKKNAINNAMWWCFADALNRACESPQVRCVLLTGSGDNFSAGVDLSSFGDAEGEGSKPFDAAAQALVAFDKPLLAAANGIAIGGGATILFHCDVLYVGESLRMRLPFANLGLVPEFASSYMLQANIGARRAAELFYTAEWIDAERALETGIATRVYPDAELLERAQEKAREIAQWPVNALQETKRCLKLAHRAALDAALLAESEAMRRQAGSAENVEAITAFFEKRPPDFSKLYNAVD